MRSRLSNEDYPKRLTMKLDTGLLFMLAQYPFVYAVFLRATRGTSTTPVSLPASFSSLPSSDTWPGAMVSRARVSALIVMMDTLACQLRAHEHARADEMARSTQDRVRNRWHVKAYTHSLSLECGQEILNQLLGDSWHIVVRRGNRLFRGSGGHAGIFLGCILRRAWSLLV